MLWLIPLKSFTLQTLGEAQKAPGEEALHPQDSAHAPALRHHLAATRRCPNRAADCQVFVSQVAVISLPQFKIRSYSPRLLAPESPTPLQSKDRGREDHAEAGLCAGTARLGGLVPAAHLPARARRPVAVVNNHGNIFQNLPNRATQSSIFESSRIQTAQNSHRTWSRLIFRHTNLSSMCAGSALTSGMLPAGAQAEQEGCRPSPSCTGDSH